MIYNVKYKFNEIKEHVKFIIKIIYNNIIVKLYKNNLDYLCKQHQLY